jgi:hypothetical protein
LTSTVRAACPAGRTAKIDETVGAGLVRVKKSGLLLPLAALPQRPK